MDPTIHQISSMGPSGELGLQLTMSPGTRAKDVGGSRKLPRTPDEYAKLDKKNWTAELSQSTGNVIHPVTKRQSLSDDGELHTESYF